MAFVLGNHSIDEILYGVALNAAGEVQYVLDQLSTASIEISAESTDITDKKGNLVKTIYTSKTGTFNATNAFLHPQVMNASSGSAVQVASATSKIQMPAYAIVEPGKTLDLSKAETGTVKAVGRSGNGADVKILTSEEIAAATSSGTFTAPEEAGVTTYFVTYDEKLSDGIKLTNDATTFPKTVTLKLFCSYVDPCSDELKSCVVEIPKLTPDPNVTISLDRESQEMDFNGTIAVDYCSGSGKTLYNIYYPGTATVASGVVDGE